jgi:hypothetical protein
MCEYSEARLCSVAELQAAEAPATEAQYKSSLCGIAINQLWARENCWSEMFSSSFGASSSGTDTELRAIKCCNEVGSSGRVPCDYDGDAQVHLHVGYSSPEPPLLVSVPLHLVASRESPAEMGLGLRRQLLGLCESQAGLLTWSPQACEVDLEQQVVTWVERVCRATGAVPLVEQVFACPPLRLRLGASSKASITPLRVSSGFFINNDLSSDLLPQVEDYCTSKNGSFSPQWEVSDCISNMQLQLGRMNTTVDCKERRRVAMDMLFDFGTDTGQARPTDRVSSFVVGPSDHYCEDNALFFPCLIRESITLRHPHFDLILNFDLTGVLSWGTIHQELPPRLKMACHHGLSWLSADTTGADLDDCGKFLLGQVNEHVAFTCQQWVPVQDAVPEHANAALLNTSMTEPSASKESEVLNGQFFVGMIGAKQPYRFDLKCGAGKIAELFSGRYHQRGIASRQTFHTETVHTTVADDGRWMFVSDIVNPDTSTRPLVLLSTRPPWSGSMLLQLTGEEAGSERQAFSQLTSIAVRLEPSPSRQLKSRATNHLALCFSGINRSLKWTFGSIKRSILDVLDAADSSYDVFFHTYSLRTLNSPHAGELGVDVQGGPFEEALAFQTHLRRYSVTLQGEFDAVFTLPEYAMREGEFGFDSTTVRNVFRDMNSLREVTVLWEEESVYLRDSRHASYTLVLYLRPDLFYHDALDVSLLWQAALATSSFLSPTWQTFSGLNDRVAIGSPAVMRVFGRRLDFLEAVEAKTQSPWLIPEVFLKVVMVELHAFSPIAWDNFRASRVRATGRILCYDFWSSYDGIGNPVAPECSPYHAHVPSCHIATPRSCRAPQ